MAITRLEDPESVPAQAHATLIDRSRSGCCLALERLQIESVHLLECLEDADRFRIVVTLPERSRAPQPRLARVAWINRTFEGTGPVFRVGFSLGKKA